MSIQLLPAASRTPKPWKNGGGVTTDVFVWPEGAGMDQFLARVSIAEVASDGPFSLFAGIDRTTAILSGGGFDLTFEGTRTRRLTGDAPPLSYSGDTPAAATLIAGATTDLNAMSRRGRATHRMARVTLTPGAFATNADITILLITEGEATLSKGSEGHTLGTLDAIAITGAQTIAVAGTHPATAYRVEFSLNPA